MKVLGLDFRPIRKHELKDVFINKLKNNDLKSYENIAEGHNFLINDNFLFGYNELPLENTVFVYMVRDENLKQDGIYVRKKIKIFKAYMDKFLKDKRILSYVRIDLKEAQKLNRLLFNFETDPVKIEDKQYIYFFNKT